MSAMSSLLPGAGGAPAIIWDFLALYRFAVAVAVSDLASSPESKYQDLIDAIMYCTFSRLYCSFASSGQQSDHSGQVHWSWTVTTGLTAGEPWSRNHDASPCRPCDAA